MKAEEMKQEFVMKYRLIAFDKDGKRRCNEEEMLVGIDKICDAVIAERSPSNEQIHEAALAWARDHSEAPDKDCPTWLIRDYEAGAYFVRQCYGCWNKTDKMVEERLIEFGEMIRDEPNGDIAALAEYFIRTINLKSR